MRIWHYRKYFISLQRELLNAEIMEQKFDNELMTTVGYFCPCMEDEEMDSEVVTINEGFQPKCVIDPVLMPIPKEGTVGYVKFENPNDYVGETEPRWFDVDEYEFEAIS